MVDHKLPAKRAESGLIIQNYGKEKETHHLYKRQYSGTQHISCRGGKLETFLAEEDIDISECVVIEGDLTLDSLVVYGGFVAVSGEVQKGG